MDAEKQRQRRRNNVRLTDSGNARSEQLLPKASWAFGIPIQPFSVG